jgi:serine/threonine-protein kinase
MLADRYELDTQVAAGGMGEVWLATDTLLRRRVAVKLLRESLANDPVVSERFRREALLVAQLSHPNIADVYDYVQQNGRPGIVMEFVEGETLAARIAREGPLNVPQAISIASALLSALQKAHDAGIVHRDVKPGNVIITPAGGVKVTDFGIARAVGDHTLTETGMIIGTAHYLSPEQVSGKPATPASDLYAVGAVVYEMLTGRRPFEAEAMIAVAMQRLTADPTAPRKHRPDIPQSVERVVMQALERDPTDRFDSAEGMRTALEDSLTEEHPIAPPTAVLPISDGATTQVIGAGAADPTITLTPEPVATADPITGEAPARAVAARRRRDYKRAVSLSLVLAAGAVAAVFVILALTGGGQDLVRVPNFKGMRIEQARAAADRLGIDVREVARECTCPAGEVTGQNVPAGVSVASGQSILLGVSTGVPPAPAGVPVPDVVGMERDIASDVLKRAGFVVKVTELETDQADPDRVIGQEPGADEIQPRGSEVAIVVAVEPKKHHGRGQGD